MSRKPSEENKKRIGAFFAPDGKQIDPEKRDEWIKKKNKKRASWGDRAFREINFLTRRSEE